jgi:HEPN domain-containing protein/predicted nucleotidyltransferase
MYTNLASDQKFSSERYRIWLLQAQYDIKAAQKSLEDKFYEWSCYQSVQAVEKALKSVIIHAGWRSPKTHKLGVLLSMCNRANDSFRQVKFNFRKIEVYTFISRYPFIYPGENNAPHDLITEHDAKTCLEIANTMIDKVEGFLHDIKPTTQSKGDIDLESYYFTPEEVNSRIESIITELSTDKTISVFKIILFGSFAREKLHPRSSTMDLLIVADTNLPFIERIQYVRELTKDDEPIIEPLVYTSKEFEFMLNDEREGYVESAIDEGKVLFDKSISDTTKDQVIST